jgi:hypothetical protein
MTARTQDEILARIAEVASDDFLGFRSDVLLTALDFEHAKEWLKAETTAEDWAEAQVADIAGKTRWYYDFALGKIEDHRGISASRSTVKLREYAWLLGRDDAVTAMGAAEYENYGAPQVKAFAEAMGYPWPDNEDLSRMAAGKPCSEGCTGCGS